MPISHKFASAKTDGSDATLVQPGDWNDNHNFVPWSITMLFHAGGVNWTIPVASQEFQGNVFLRQKADLTYATEVRLLTSFSIASVSGARVRMEYSTDASTWLSMDGSNGPDNPADVTGLQVSSWLTLVSGAKADVFLRIVGVSGDGTTSSTIRHATLYIR